MIIELKLDGNDFLAHHLYTASKSDLTKKTRRNNRIMVPIVFCVLGSLFFFQHRIGVGLIYLSIAALWFIFYPLRDKHLYINHYKKFIKERYKVSCNAISTLEFTNDYIFAKDEGTENKILWKEVVEINEISTSIFIKLRSAQSVILPKDKIKDLDLLVSMLKDIAVQKDIKYNIDLNWKWS
jgi:YcxB-like protein